MSSLNGVFELRDPHDLLQKLEFDYKRLDDAADPVGAEAQYAAFDFFTTAEHLADWQMHASGTPAKEWRGRYPEGAMVRHIASGAKHFKATRPEHTTVRDTLAVDGAFDPNVFDRRAFDVPRLVIELENGTTEDILDVAERVLAHWQATIK